MMKLTFFTLLTLVSLVLSGALYCTSYKVHAMESHRQAIHVAMESEQARLQVLKAEWAYLANPLRLEREARQRLALAPTDARRIGRLDTLAALAPTRQEAAARAAGRPVVAATVPEQAALASRQVAEVLTARASVMP